MKKFITYFIIIVSCLTVFGGKQDFIYDYFMFERNLPQKEAFLMASTIYNDSVAFNIEPLLILSIMETETNVRNVVGDNGDAIGYFQLHVDAVYYVSNFFPYISNKIKIIGSHDNLIKYPVLQAKIAIRYLYLMKQNTEDIILSLGRYNGQTDYINKYSVKVLNNYVIFSEKYLTYNYK